MYKVFILFYKFSKFFCTVNHIENNFVGCNDPIIHFSLNILKSLIISIVTKLSFKLLIRFIDHSTIRKFNFQLFFNKNKFTCYKYFCNIISIKIPNHLNTHTHFLKQPLLSCNHLQHSSNFIDYTLPHNLFFHHTHRFCTSKYYLRCVPHRGSISPELPISFSYSLLNVNPVSCAKVYKTREKYATTSLPRYLKCLYLNNVLGVRTRNFHQLSQTKAKRGIN